MPSLSQGVWLHCVSTQIACIFYSPVLQVGPSYPVPVQLHVKPPAVLIQMPSLSQGVWLHSVSTQIACIYILLTCTTGWTLVPSPCTVTCETPGCAHTNATVITRSVATLCQYPDSLYIYYLPVLQVGPSYPVPV